LYVHQRPLFCERRPRVFHSKHGIGGRSRFEFSIFHPSCQYSHPSVQVDQGISSGQLEGRAWSPYQPDLLSQRRTPKGHPSCSIFRQAASGRIGAKVAWSSPLRTNGPCHPAPQIPSKMSGSQIAASSSASAMSARYRQRHRAAPTLIYQIGCLKEAHVGSW